MLKKSWSESAGERVNSLPHLRLSVGKTRKNQEEVEDTWEQSRLLRSTRKNRGWTLGTWKQGDCVIIRV